MSLATILLMGLGAGAVVAGFAVLWFGRRAGDEDGAQEHPPRHSHPTRLVMGLLLLIVGYHLAVWAVPETLTPLQWPRRRWYVLIAAAVVLAGLSMWLDGLEGRRLGGRAKDHGPG